MTMNPKPVDRAKLYPLWCLDHGEDQLDDRFSGPYGTVREAVDCRGEFDNLFGDGGGEIRRCRPQVPSELVDDWGWAAELLRDHTDDRAMNGADAAWGDWEEPRVALRDEQAAARDLAAWADKHLVTHTYVCEGDEQVEGMVVDVPPALAPDYDTLLTLHNDTLEQLALVEKDAVIGQSEVDALIAELEELREDRQAALNACESWRLSYQEACEELAVVRRRGMGGSARALAEVAWNLALWMGEYPGGGGGEGGPDLAADDFLFCDGARFGVGDTIDTITASAHRLRRAEALRDQAQSKAKKLRAEKLEAERERDATARELARALARIEELEAGRVG